MSILRSKIAFTFLMFALAGCGSKGSDPDPASGAKGARTNSAWNAADACSILDKAAVADILKREISSTQLSLVHEADGATAATSECAYLGADGASVARLMTRWSPIDDNTPETISGARSAAAAALKAFGGSATIEDIQGLGKAAFLAPKIDQLNVFIDNARMITVTVEKVPEGASGKDLAIALAKKAGA